MATKKKTNPVPQESATRQKIRKLIAAAASKCGGIPNLVRPRQVTATLLDDFVLAIEYRGKIAFVKLDRTCYGDIDGVGEFGLKVLGYSLIDLLVAKKLLSKKEALEANQMLRDHEQKREEARDLGTLRDLAKKYNYNLSKSED